MTPRSLPAHSRVVVTFEARVSHDQGGQTKWLRLVWPTVAPMAAFEVPWAAISTLHEVPPDVQAGEVWQDRGGHLWHALETDLGVWLYPPFRDDDAGSRRGGSLAEVHEKWFLARRLFKPPPVVLLDDAADGAAPADTVWATAGVSGVEGDDGSGG